MNSISKIFSHLSSLAESKSMIFRGENNIAYGAVTSNLHRELKRLFRESGQQFPLHNLELQQSLFAEECQRYCADASDQESTLWQLQHYGGNTNLIDFTTDYRIALYFACDGSFDKSGRIICLPKTTNSTYQIQEPAPTVDRANIQRSIFVEVPTGALPESTYTITKIPHDLKRDILDRLWIDHGIFTKTIYSDIHGYIQHKERHLDSWLSVYEGQNHLMAGRYTDAIESFTKSIQGYYHWPIAYNLRGNAYAELGCFKKALENFDRALRLDPQYALAYANRGATLVDMGELDCAVHDFHKALDLNPKLEGPHIGLGRAFQNKNEFEKCGSHYNKAAKLGPDNIMVWNHIGNWHHQSGRIDEAIQHYDIALALEADAISKLDTYRRGIPFINVDRAQSDAFFSRGSAYHKKGCLNKAIEDYENSLKLQQRSDAFCQCGLAWLELKSWSKGQDNLSAANSLGADVGKNFALRFQSLFNFEMVVGTKLPNDIVELLKKFGMSE